MKRDMDLVRKILQAFEGEDHSSRMMYLHINGYKEEEINYHMLIMIDAGLLVGIPFPLGEGIPHVVPERMTWQGHDFLDAARDDTRWDKAKGIMAKIGGVTFEIMKQILTQVMADQMKQIMGIQS
ncbi:MAG: DUF2513 domain-containing protein [bacterium]|nr:DUF2513 domain-containing protein [bacterium]